MICYGELLTVLLNTLTNQWNSRSSILRTCPSQEYFQFDYWTVFRLMNAAWQVQYDLPHHYHRPKFTLLITEILILHPGSFNTSREKKKISLNPEVFELRAKVLSLFLNLIGQMDLYFFFCEIQEVQCSNLQILKL